MYYQLKKIHMLHSIHTWTKLDNWMFKFILLTYHMKTKITFLKQM